MKSERLSCIKCGKWIDTETAIPAAGKHYLCLDCGIFPRKSVAKPPSLRRRISSLPIARLVGEPPILTESWNASRISGFANQCRDNPTPAEAELNKILMGLKDGVLRGKFIRQHAISGKWIVDFFFPDIRLAIEVDGSIHRTENQSKRDRLKDADCAEYDITMLRITNSEVFGDRNKLVEKLRSGWRMALLRENKIIGVKQKCPPRK